MGTNRRKRDSITYVSRNGGEWLRTRDLRDAVAKVEGLLDRLTTFRRWQAAELAIDLPSSPAVDALHAQIEPFQPRPRCSRAALAARGIEADDVLGDALVRFGPAYLVRWRTDGADGRGARYRLAWERAECPTPDDWIAYVAGRRRMMFDGHPRAALTLASPVVRWADPTTGAPLPFQDADLYPPRADAAPGCYVRVRLALPECSMVLDGRLPFERADDRFVAYYDRITDALGHPLPPRHFRATLANRHGTGTYERRLPFAR